MFSERGPLPVLRQVQADRGRLHRYLDGALGGQALGGELADQAHVLFRDSVGLSLFLRVLTEVVECDQQPLGAESLGCPHRVGAGFPGDIPIHDAARHWVVRNELTNPLTSRSRQQRPTEHAP